MRMNTGSISITFLFQRENKEWIGKWVGTLKWSFKNANHSSIQVFYKVSLLISEHHSLAFFHSKFLPKINIFSLVSVCCFSVSAIQFQVSSADRMIFSAI